VERECDKGKSKKPAAQVGLQLRDTGSGGGGVGSSILHTIFKTAARPRKGAAASGKSQNYWGRSRVHYSP